MKGRGRTVTKERYIWIWGNDIFEASSLMSFESLEKLTSNFPKESLDRRCKREVYFFLFHFGTRRLPIDPQNFIQ